MNTTSPSESGQDQTNEHTDAQMMSQAGVMEKANNIADLYHSTIVTQAGSYLEQRDGEEKQNDTKELKNLFAELISADRPEYTLTEDQMPAVLELLQDPKMVVDLQARKEMGEELVVKLENGKPIFVNAADNLDIPRTMARLKALTNGENGSERIDDYVKYEVQRGEKHVNPLTDDEAPEFKKWMKDEMASMESGNGGPNRTGAGFLAWAHHCRLVSIPRIEELARDNKKVGEKTWTWTEEDGKTLLDVWRHVHKYAPGGDRRHGSAYHGEGAADYRDGCLGVRLVG